jgi:hypothetical protein
MGRKLGLNVNEQKANSLNVVSCVVGDHNMVRVTTKSSQGHEVTQRLMYQPALIQERAQPTPPQRALVKSQ